MRPLVIAVRCASCQAAEQLTGRPNHNTLQYRELSLVYVHRISKALDTALIKSNLLFETMRHRGTVNVKLYSLI